MRILLWHGYLLGGTGSNVYTRQLAREWRRAGHDVTVLSQEPRPGRVRPRRRHDRPPRRRRPAARPSSSTATRDTRSVSSRTAPAQSSTRGWRRTPPPCVRSCPPTSCSRTTCCSEARSGGFRARRSPSRPTGPSSSTRCAGTPELSAWGAESLARRAGDVRRLRAHPAGARGRLRARRAGARGPAGRRRRPLAAGGAGGRPRRPARGGRARPAEPGEPRGAAPRRRQRRATRRVSRRRRARRSSTSAS